ncbi:MAG: hypothetical protein LKH07_05155 [Acetobacter peroxydans]|jgi:hypothetical protein|nr:hypothetical protein [Acetobacter peroxydans]
MSEELEERLFWQHMDLCAHFVRKDMRPDTKVTIIVRAPEALPHEAMIYCDDSLSIVRDAVDYFDTAQNARAEDRPCPIKWGETENG